MDIFQYHPDSAGGSDVSADFKVQKFTEITEAYEVRTVIYYYSFRVLQKHSELNHD